MSIWWPQQGGLIPQSILQQSLLVGNIMEISKTNLRFLRPRLNSGIRFRGRRALLYDREKRPAKRRSSKNGEPLLDQYHNNADDAKIKDDIVRIGSESARKSSKSPHDGMSNVVMVDKLFLGHDDDARQDQVSKKFANSDGETHELDKSSTAALKITIPDFQKKQKARSLLHNSPSMQQQAATSKEIESSGDLTSLGSSTESSLGYECKQMPHVVMVDKLVLGHDAPQDQVSKKFANSDGDVHEQDKSYSSALIHDFEDKSHLHNSPSRQEQEVTLKFVENSGESVVRPYAQIERCLDHGNNADANARDDVDARSESADTSSKRPHGMSHVGMMDKLIQDHDAPQDQVVKKFANDYRDTDEQDKSSSAILKTMILYIEDKKEAQSHLHNSPSGQEQEATPPKVVEESVDLVPLGTAESNLGCKSKQNHDDTEEKHMTVKSLLRHHSSSRVTQQESNPSIPPPVIQVIDKTDSFSTCTYFDDKTDNQDEEEIHFDDGSRKLQNREIPKFVCFERKTSSKKKKKATASKHHSCAMSKILLVNELLKNASKDTIADFSDGKVVENTESWFLKAIYKVEDEEDKRNSCGMSKILLVDESLKNASKETIADFSDRKVMEKSESSFLKAIDKVEEEEDKRNHQ